MTDREQKGGKDKTMEKYTVNLIITYALEIEADTEEEAERKALDMDIADLPYAAAIPDLTRAIVNQ